MAERPRRPRRARSAVPSAQRGADPGREREATVAADQAERRRKPTYAVRREHVGIRFSRLKAQALSGVFAPRTLYGAMSPDFVAVDDEEEAFRMVAVTKRI